MILAIQKLNASGECETILAAVTPEQRKLAYELITNPPPGSKLAEAKEYGVDLTLLVENLARTPTERARELSEGARIFQIAEQNLRAEK